MGNNAFIPGKVVKTFETEKGHEVVVRYPRWEDLDKLTNYINALSQEDTFIRFSGETITVAEESEFLAGWFKRIDLSNGVMLCGFVADNLAGACGIERNEIQRQRSRHAGIFGIAVARQFRGEGIGYELARATIDEAKKMIPGLRLLTLDVFGKNVVAQGLYRKLGFEEVGRIPEAILYKGEYTDNVIMYLCLCRAPAV